MEGVARIVLGLDSPPLVSSTAVEEGTARLARGAVADRPFPPKPLFQRQVARPVSAATGRCGQFIATFKTDSL